MPLPEVELVAPTLQRAKFARIGRMLLEGVIWGDYWQDLRITGPIIRNMFTLCDISYTSLCRNFQLRATRLYTPLCRSVGRVVGWLVGWLVGPRFILLAFLRFFRMWLLPKCPGDLLQHCSCPNALVTFSSTAPAHPHANVVAVYPALL